MPTGCVEKKDPRRRVLISELLSFVFHNWVLFLPGRDLLLFTKRRWCDCDFRKGSENCCGWLCFRITTSTFYPRLPWLYWSISCYVFVPSSGNLSPNKEKKKKKTECFLQFLKGVRGPLCRDQKGSLVIRGMTPNCLGLTL